MIARQIIPHDKPFFLLKKNKKECVKKNPPISFIFLDNGSLNPYIIVSCYVIHVYIKIVVDDGHINRMSEKKVYLAHQIKT